MSLLVDVLRTVEFLADGTGESAAQLMAVGRSRDLSSGHVFWSAGQRPQGIVIPVSGALAEVKVAHDGRAFRSAVLGTGECAGFPSVLDGLAHATAAGATRSGEFFSVEREAFLRLLDHRPALRALVLAMLGRLYRESLEEHERMVFLPVGVRLARLLLDRSCIRLADGARVLPRETHAELAARLGSVREVVARAMAKFAAEGLVRSAKDAVFISDWAGLRAKARSDDDGPDASRLRFSAAALRTRRFALPVLAGGATSAGQGVSACREYLGDLSLCVARGCPLAASARDDSPTRRRDLAIASPAVLHAHDGLRSEGGAPGERAFAGATAPGAASFVAGEGRAAEQRIEAYRGRASRIEASYGKQAAVPAFATVFGRTAPAERGAPGSSATVDASRPPARSRGRRATPDARRG